MFRAKHPRRGVLALASPLLALIPRKAGADMPEPYSAYADQYSGNGSPASAPPNDDTGGITPGTLIERLERIERWMAMHGGNIGAANAQYPHPDTSIRTAYFGSGEMRLDEQGIQLLAPSGNLDGIAWVAEFRDPPTSIATAPLSYIRGDADSTPSLSIQSKFDGSNDALLNIGAANGSASTIAQASSTYGAASVGVYAESNRSSVELTGSVKFVSTASRTIASGVITAITESGEVNVDTEGGAGTDDLDTITAQTTTPTGQLLIVRAANDARTVVIKNGTGNISCGGDITLDHTDDVALLYYTGSVWICLAQQNNNA